MGKHIIKRKVKELANAVKVPHTHILDIGVEEEARGVYRVDPHIALVLGAVDAILHPLRHHPTVEQQAHGVGIQLLHLVNVVYILYGNGHHFADPALALVAGNAHRAHKVLPQLSLDVAEYGRNHIVLERNLAVFLYEVALGHLRKRVGVGNKVAPLVTIAVHKASPQFAASLIKSIPAGGAFVEELVGRARFLWRFLHLAGVCFHTFVKKFIHHIVVFSSNHRIHHQGDGSGRATSGTPVHHCGDVSSHLPCA